MEDRCMMSLRSMMDTLVDAQKSELAKGVDSADTEESGKVIDMIKDLAQAQKYCRSEERRVGEEGTSGERG